ncbi:hypothetical protein TSUD_145530 [Trifolium subterraneum]|uniref:Secreted protein n=1 Tax=Trifolium subterraneum TaxID=3900 RepID=A0A2Z6MKH5_TRISU|nr:hypothetical protein TSUD_145530 [Trifolium subterraneum]
MCTSAPVVPLVLPMLCLVCPSPGFPLACAGGSVSADVGASIYGSSTGGSFFGEDGFDDVCADVGSSTDSDGDFDSGSCFSLSKRQKTM